MNEYEGAGALPGEIASPGFEHFPCVLLVDVSGSMEGYERQLMDAIREAKNAIEEDSIASEACDVCLILFNSSVRVIQNFGPVYDLRVPQIRCSGRTHTHEAIAKAIELAEARKAQYSREGITYKQPWYWLFTDGDANDTDNGSFGRLLQLQRDRKALFFGVGIGNEVSQKKLAAMDIQHRIFKCRKEDLRAAFQFFTQTQIHATHRSEGTSMEVTLPSQLQVVKVDLF